jgi:phosphoribosyl-AMP cyclohydrolase / phosphoribosyl-ATP pyrophosphohydrolase
MNSNINNIIEKIDWEKVNNLLPVVVQEYKTKNMLMLGYMNKEALTLSLKTNKAHYFSRTKNRIWQKGETSGHIQNIYEVLLDCDNDTLLIQVIQKGVVCHTLNKTCFFQSIKKNDIKIDDKNKTPNSIIDILYNKIKLNKTKDPKISYTAKLLQGDQNYMLKKVVEEVGEFILSIKDNDVKNIIYEAADIIYHMLIAINSKDITPDDIKKELQNRFNTSGIQEKNSRTTKS